MPKLLETTRKNVLYFDGGLTSLIRYLLLVSPSSLYSIVAEAFSQWLPTLGACLPVGRLMFRGNCE